MNGGFRGRSRRWNGRQRVEVGRLRGAVVGHKQPVIKCEDAALRQPSGRTQGSNVRLAWPETTDPPTALARSLDLRVPAISEQFTSGHEAALIGGKKQGGGSEFVRLPHPSDRNPCNQGCCCSLLLT